MLSHQDSSLSNQLANCDVDDNDLYYTEVRSKFYLLLSFYFDIALRLHKQVDIEFKIFKRLVRIRTFVLFLRRIVTKLLQMMGVSEHLMALILL